MTPARLKPVLVWTCCAVLLLSACTRKKIALPPQPQAPTVPEQQPPQTGSPAQIPDQTKDQPTPEPAPNATTKHPKPGAPTHKPAPRPSNNDDKSNAMAANTPPKIVIQEARSDASAAAPVQVAPLTAHTDAAHNQATTEQLMESTDANLRSIKRQLSSDEQAQAEQIHEFLAQSRQATKEKDLVRARNLAMKAHLLSDELVKLK